MAHNAEALELWRAHVSDEERAQLDALANDEQALSDAFYCELSFGTGGMRGIIGLGTSRMNVYTVARATQGLADYLTAHFDEPSVAVARDSRRMGETFTQTIAGVLCANGVRVMLYPRVAPTPALSFAVRALGCSAGINVTASHNPAEYSGYKVYGPDGCQVATEAAEAIQSAIDAVSLFDGVKLMDFNEALANGSATWIDDAVLDAFLDAVCAQSLEALDAHADVPLRIAYTPLNGTGRECIMRMFERIDISDVHIVAEQAEPNGEFPTCPYPNPECAEALERGLALSRAVEADLLIATDPDADRVGIAVAHDGDYVLLTGNEVGVLLVDYVATMRARAGQDLSGAVVISTIVSTLMTDAQAREFGFELRRVLTGFKYIGSQVLALEEASQLERFMFGFEESYGYLSGPHVRDKDSINATMLIAQMARWHKSEGRDLVQAMETLYERYGYYLNRTLNMAYPGEAGAAEMTRILDALRNDPPARIAGYDVQAFTDFSHPVPMPRIGGEEGEAELLPCSNVLSFQLDEGIEVIIRPSGTEPKIKAYLFSRGQTHAQAIALLDTLEGAARELLA